MQPSLDAAAREAGIGEPLTCLSYPGMTDLGRFGADGAPEEGSLAACLDGNGIHAGGAENATGLVHGASGRLTALTEASQPFDIALKRRFDARVTRDGTIDLAGALPWLPSLRVGDARTEQVSIGVVLEGAHFLTLTEVASRLRGQARADECLKALCQQGYRYVHKVLVARPRVVVSTASGQTPSLRVSALGGALSAGWQEHAASVHGSSVTSQEPLTIAAAHIAFRTAYTERACAGCGELGQSCCTQGNACFGGTGCQAGRCVELGKPGLPCDRGECAPGATCVQGTCEAQCGAKGQTCCEAERCGKGLGCRPDPKTLEERRVYSELWSESGGLFGTSADRVLGDATCGPGRGRARYAVTRVGDGRGSCERAWWFDPRSERDCRVGVKVDVGTLSEIQCRVEVFAKPLEQIDLCLP